MRKIGLRGKEYLFTGDSLEGAGGIATEEQYRDGVMSYAWLDSIGVIHRDGEIIGARNNIEDLGECDEPALNPSSYENVVRRTIELLAGPSLVRRGRYDEWHVGNKCED